VTAYQRSMASQMLRRHARSQANDSSKMARGRADG
jgi:hypothetical protein